MCHIRFGWTGLDTTDYLRLLYFTTRPGLSFSDHVPFLKQTYLILLYFTHFPLFSFPSHFYYRNFKIIKLKERKVVKVRVSGCGILIEKRYTLKTIRGGNPKIEKKLKTDCDSDPIGIWSKSKNPTQTVCNSSLEPNDNRHPIQLQLQPANRLRWTFYLER